jgi:hypothetical protein
LTAEPVSRRQRCAMFGSVIGKFTPMNKAIAQGEPLN